MKEFKFREANEVVISLKSLSFETDKIVIDDMAMMPINQQDSYDYYNQREKRKTSKKK